MSNVTHGMSVTEIEALGRRLDTGYATELTRIMSEIEALVQASARTWVGPDAERFRAWWPAKRSKIRAIADELSAYGSTAIRHAAEQRAASDGGNSPVAYGGSSAATWRHDLGALAVGAAGAALVPLRMVSNVGAVLDGIGKAERFGRKLDLFGPVGGALFSAIDVQDGAFKIYDGYVERDPDSAIRGAIDVGWAIASKNLYVAAVKGSWDIGWEIGTWIDDKTGYSDVSSDYLIDKVIREQYGGDLSPQESHELAHRYDGIRGFGRWIGDQL